MKDKLLKKRLKSYCIFTDSKEKGAKKVCLKYALF
nr:MAG TPA: hypothetical protein [Bacteriophage sp.]